MKDGIIFSEKEKKVSRSAITRKIERTGYECIFMILCCVAGVLAKKAINPAANMMTDFLHIPGGISTALSLMFLVMGAGLTNGRWNAGIMGLVQGISALLMGSVGSMGVLIPVAYFIPGVVIDLMMLLPLKTPSGMRVKAFLANLASSLSAALFADVMVFHLPLNVLTVYILVAALSGAVCGYAAGEVINLTHGDKNE
ncbi:hypothetical protein [Oribacterium sp. P6A1]|uniref:hypothetical protein n=1 Tax=Oribacterium sp. P6A1 TaxID=1410612 RepID=UPI000567FF21|nr:hypothetical protein [Oribacterium sp. P6A1]